MDLPGLAAQSSRARMKQGCTGSIDEGMMRNISFSRSVSLAILVVISAAAQQPSTSPTPGTDSQTEKKRVLMTPEARLASARNVLVVRTHGGDIPYDVIRTTVEGWGRYTLVAAPDKADLIIEVASSGGGGDIRVSSSSSTSSQTGRPEQSNSTSKDISATDLSLTVIDAQNKRILWHATETAKYAVKQKARENNLVEAAERLASIFHDRIEPQAIR